MSHPEILPYGDNDNPLGEPQGYKGMLYRFDDAEHIGFEKSPEWTVVFLSTPHDTQTIARFYEHVFATAAIVEPSIDDEPDDNDDNTTVTTSISIGPTGCMIVANPSFRLSWLASHQPFWDREAETAQVHMYQEGDGLDLRHRELVTLMASEGMHSQLGDILQEY